MRISIILLILSLAGYSYYQTSCPTEKKKLIPSNCTPETPLYHNSLFKVGVAINLPEYMKNSRYRKIVDFEYNSITPENCFKFDALHPQINEYKFNNADWLVNYCQKNNKRLHAHNLVWFFQLPPWVINYKGSPKDWDNILKNHIQTVVGRYKGKIESWDVVNEVFNADGTWKQNVWYNNLGKSYVEKAFKYAHEADTSALLFYNEYETEWKPAARLAAINLVQELKQKKIPINGFGMEMHLALAYPSIEEIKQATNEIVTLGLLIHYSEIDLCFNTTGNPQFKINDSLLCLQADKYGQLIELYKTIPAKQQYGITFWGLSDANSWIPSTFNRKDYPLLFDSLYQPKPAYYEVKNKLCE